MTVSDDILLDITKDARTRVIHEAKLAGLEFSGQLTDENNWEIVKNDDGGYTLGCRLLWAAIQEDGRMPGKMPPVRALIPWVFQKLGAKDEAELKSKAYLVARKIAEKGTEPKHYIKKALFSLEAETS